MAAGLMERALPYLPEWWTSASPAAQVDNWMCAALIGSMLPAALVLLAGVQAPYGRYSSASWGFLVNGKLAWVLQELPSFALPALFAWRTFPSAHSANPANVALLVAFSAHYFNRTFVFPLTIRGGKGTPCSVFLMARAFCLTNGWVQARALTVHHLYPSGWTSDPRFLVGLALFAIGMAINVQVRREGAPPPPAGRKGGRSGRPRAISALRVRLRER
jgi:3-oxo-5-alpha-steroid 4-dehydrogenase 1